MSVFEAIRNNERKILANHLVCGVTKNFHRSLIPIQHRPLGVSDHDCLNRSFRDRAKACFAQLAIMRLLFETRIVRQLIFHLQLGALRLANNVNQRDG